MLGKAVANEADLSCMEPRPLGFFARTRWGGDEREPSVERLQEILSQLDAEDDEHTSVSLSHESEWYLAAYPSGLLVWENAEAGDNPRHMNDVTRARVLELWIKLSRGSLHEIELEPWLPGYEGQE
ncbi:hypothetical protein TA3x_002617 [Tundrisphaera sp. TA3]|uniref:hypothetical protein n=1 Tax=Tundrisphaera sp. TA3 TaxID=3435775 RepID=UPI003EBC9E65